LWVASEPQRVAVVADYVVLVLPRFDNKAYDSFLAERLGSLQTV
jgi:hypothetical protein